MDEDAAVAAKCGPVCPVSGYVSAPRTMGRNTPAAGWSKDSAQDYSQDEDEYDRMVIERARANKDALMQYGRSE